MSDKDLPTNETMDISGAMAAMKARRAIRAEEASLEAGDDPKDSEDPVVESLGDDADDETTLAALDDDTAEGDVDAVESDAASEPEDTQPLPEDAPAAPSGDTDPDLPTTLPALAQAIDVDEQYLRSLTVTVDRDGEEETVSLDDALAQVAGKSETAQQRQELDAERQEYTQKQAALQQQTEQLQTVLANIDQLLPQEDDMDLDRIAEEEGEVAYIQAVRQAEKRKAARQEAIDSAQKTLEELQAQQLEQLKEQAASENVSFRKNNNLLDDKTYSAEMQESIKYLQGHGFTDAEINQTIDSRIWTVILEGMRFRRTLTKATKAQKKLKKLPKKIKSGTGQVKQTAVADNVARLKRKAERTGNPRDAAAFMRASRRAREAAT